MNKGRIGVEYFPRSKPTWEIMKIMSEITDFISPIIFGAIFGARTCKNVESKYQIKPPNRYVLGGFIKI